MVKSSNLCNMNNWLVKRAERAGNETVMNPIWWNHTVTKEPVKKRTYKMARKKLTTRLSNTFKLSKGKNKEITGVETNKTVWGERIQKTYDYIYCNHYQQNWWKSIITLVIITITLHYLLQIIILLLEQARKTMVSFYKWQILSSVVSPNNNSTLGSIINVSSWFQLLKAIITTLIQ